MKSCRGIFRDSRANALGLSVPGIPGPQPFLWRCGQGCTCRGIHTSWHKYFGGAWLQHSGTRHSSGALIEMMSLTLHLLDLAACRPASSPFRHHPGMSIAFGSEFPVVHRSRDRRRCPCIRGDNTVPSINSQATQA